MKGNRERRARELCEKNNNNTQLLARVCENYEYMRMADQSNQKKRKRRKKYSAKYSSGSKEIEMYGMKRARGGSDRVSEKEEIL